MTRLLLALALLAVTARLLRKRHPAPSPQYDDSEVVGMPTTWAWDDAMSDPSTRHALTQGLREAATGRTNSWTLGPGWWVEFAPTSRN